LSPDWRQAEHRRGRQCAQDAEVSIASQSSDSESITDHHSPKIHPHRLRPEDRLRQCRATPKDRLGPSQDRPSQVVASLAEMDLGARCRKVHARELPEVR
jgi:hypothetical protein